MKRRRDELGEFLNQRQTECLFGWYGKKKDGVNVFHNCKLKNRHRGKHKCIVKYRGTDIEQPCKATKERS